MIKLDFSLQSEQQRLDYINQYDLSKLSQSQLELCANYILYGKDKTGKSEVDKKHIYINTKYDSYKTKRPESLDALIDTGSFDEVIIPKYDQHYKTVKPTIDRVKDADIPTMKKVWEGIDYLQHILDVNLGKAEPDPGENVPKLTPTELYKWQHMVIDVRRNQYYLKDIFKPTINKYFNKLNYIPYHDANEADWNDPNSDYGFAPLGLINDFGVGKLVFSDATNYEVRTPLYNENARHIIDFRNPKHIYSLMDYYEELATAALDNPTSLMGLIVRTLDYYIDRANLKDQHYTIIEMKKLHKKNKEINEKLTELYGLHHTENYISTIWTHKVCTEIAAAAQLHYDEFLKRNDESAWKVCCTCGRRLLRDSRMFVKKNKAKDGLSGRCKMCDRVERMRRR